MRRGISLACLLMIPVLTAWAEEMEKFNDCADTGLNVCERAGQCAVESSTWYQHALIDKTDAYAAQEWSALCALSHARLAQGDCAPYGAQDYVTAYLSSTSSVFIPKITGTLACGRMLPHSKP